MHNLIQHARSRIALEIEYRVLGALIFIGKPKDLRAIQAIMALTPDSFGFKPNELLFQVINEQFDQESDFDLVTLSTMTDPRCDPVTTLLKDAYYTPSLLANDVIVLNDHRTLRRQLVILVDMLNEVNRELNYQPCLNIIAERSQSLALCTTATQDERLVSYEALIEQELTISESDTSQFTVDIPQLPAVPNRALITIAGRSGHGKTFFALYLMDKLIDVLPGKQNLYFNLEMHPRAMLDRHAILVGAKGDDSRIRISSAAPRLLEKNMSLVSVPMITIDEIEALSRVAAVKQAIGVIVVDYLGLVSSKMRYDRYDLQQNAIAKRLAALSIELDCVVILLIQVNRESKSRPVGERCPVPSDAAEGMGSVHSSSWWIGIDQPYLDNEDPEFQHVFQVQCRKNRGESGLFKFNLEFRNGRFAIYRKPFTSRYESKSQDTCLIE